MFRAVKMLFVPALVLTGCAADPAARVDEYLDPATAVTVRAVAQPIVYAHEAPELAANARDYLSAGVVEIINMDKRERYLALVSWSTIDRNRPAAGPAPVPGHVELLLGGASRELTPLTHEARSLGISEAPFRPGTGYVGESWYRLSVAELRALAQSPPTSLALLDDAQLRVEYALWREATADLRELVRDVPDAPTAGRPPR
jgi:hypothetical protein